jgi:hypothetical protein
MIFGVGSIGLPANLVFVLQTGLSSPMTGPAGKLTPADPDDLAATLAFALRSISMLTAACHRLKDGAVY